MTEECPARVAAAVDALEAEGLRPTIARVRERVQASANRVHEALQILQAQRRTQQDLQAASPDQAPLPEPLRAASTPSSRHTSVSSRRRSIRNARRPGRSGTG